MLPKMPTPNTDRHIQDGSYQFVDWTQKVKGEYMKQPVNHDGSHFETGGTGDAKFGGVGGS